MIPILKAIFPVFALVILGVILKKRKFPGEGFWPMADKLTYFILLPSLLIEKLALAELTGSAFLQIAFLIPISILAVAGLSIFTCWLLKIPSKGGPSVFQGSIRPNSYVALAVSGSLFGEEGLTLAAICLLWAVPLVNVLSVSAFSFYIPENGRHPKTILRNIATNPLVVACLIGIFLNVTLIRLPFGSNDVLSIMSKAALPLGLLSVGNGLQLRSLFVQWKPSLIGVLLKLFLLPLFIYGLSKIIGVANEVLLPTILVAAVPCAISSYILAGQLRGDQELMARIITIETLLAVLSMPIILFLVTMH